MIEQPAGQHLEVQLGQITGKALGLLLSLEGGRKNALLFGSLVSRSRLLPLFAKKSPVNS